MIIGVDCDGVLTDMSAFILKCGKKWFKRAPDNPNGYSVTGVFGCTEKEETKFGLRYFPQYCRSWPPRVVGHIQQHGTAEIAQPYLTGLGVRRFDA